MRSATAALALATVIGGCAAPAAAPTVPSAAPTESAAATEAATVQLRVTVSDDGCSLEPDTAAIAAGPIELITVNETDAQAAADLWRITGDHTFEELAAHIDEERADAQAGGPGLGHPGYVTGLINSGIVEAGATTTVEGTLQPGTHGIVCLRHFDAVTSDPFRPFEAIGPLDAG